MRPLVLKCNLIFLGVFFINLAGTYAQDILSYVQVAGKQIAPTYEKANCSELVEAVLKHFIPVDRAMARKIHIILEEPFLPLLPKHDNRIKGVQYALTSTGYGSAVTFENSLPGDLVQFWSTEGGFVWGHCGIIHSVDTASRRMKLYSSWPGVGFCLKEFPVTVNTYIVRLNTSR